MRNPLSFALGLVVVLPALLGLSPSLGEGAEPAPGFSLKDVAKPDNEMVTLTGLQGEVVLLNIFSTTCPICRAEFPELSALNRKYSGRENFRVVGIGIDPMIEPIQSLVRAAGIDYMVLMGELQTVATWKIRGFPTSLLISRKGEILKRYEGFQARSVLEADIEKLLSKGK